MFKGGAYYDRTGFAENGMPGRNNMDTSDIPGAQPGKSSGLTKKSRLSQSGQRIVDNTSMVAAGGNARVVGSNGISNIFGLNQSIDSMRKDRNPLQTHDINGLEKKNRFGQKMQVDQRLVGVTAGAAGSIDLEYQKSNKSSKMAEVFNPTYTENLPPQEVQGYAQLPPKAIKPAEDPRKKEEQQLAMMHLEEQKRMDALLAEMRQQKAQPPQMSEQEAEQRHMEQMIIEQRIQEEVKKKEEAAKLEQ